jgi:signal transduction histidine kinase
MTPDDSPDAGQPTHVGKAAFSVSSRVALQLGRESISSSITAIVELVKNAYDADAELVRVRFASSGTEGPMLVVEDTGCGMTAEDLKNYWMVIGTSYKTDRKRTEGKSRVVTGEKGLGRLGLDRLCARTEVESIRAGASEGIRLDVRWSKYESHDRLEAIEHDLYSIPSLRLDPITGKWRDFPHGTRLVLRGLKDTWDAESIEQLRNELALLVSPFQGPNDFSIEIDTGGAFQELDGPVQIQKPLLDAANWKVVATLDSEGVVEITMSSARHETEFHMKPAPWAEAIKRQGVQPHCGPLRMEFYFFVRRDAELANKTLRAGEIAGFLKFNQGIRIYRDGFRVKPYGEPDGGGDWLRLAYRRMQNPEGVAQSARAGSWRVGYNQVVGAVFITHEQNAGLNDQTNREGLLQGKAFDHLTVFAMKVIQFFEVQNQRFEMSRKAVKVSAEKAEETAKGSIDGASEAIKEIAALTAKLPALTQATDAGGEPATGGSAEIARVIDQVQRKLETATSGLERSTQLFREAEEQKNTMANLASLGILAAAFGHETLDWTGTVVKNARWLLENVLKDAIMIPLDTKEEITGTLQDTAVEAQKIRRFAEFTIGNLSREKRRRKSFDLATTVRRVFAAFDDVLRLQRNTSVDLKCVPSTPCLIEGFEMDWESVVVNLITNANWALEDSPAGQRRIRVCLSGERENWVLVFDDSGVGLEAGTEEMIFLPAYSTKRSSKGEMIGTGMGLFIVKSFVEEHSHGNVSARQKGELGGASFEIFVPKASLPQNEEAT